MLLLGLTLWLSPRRRRTLVQLTVGIALGVVLVRRVGARLEGEVVDLAQAENRDAVQVAVGAFVSSLLDATAVVLAIVTAVLVVALLTGPYALARSLRHRTAAVGRVAAILLLLLVDVSWAGLLVLAVVVGALQLALWRLAPEPAGST